MAWLQTSPKPGRKAQSNVVPAPPRMRSPAAAPSAKKLTAFAPPEAPEKVSPAPGRDVERRRERFVMPGEVQTAASEAHQRFCSRFSLPAGSEVPPLNIVPLYEATSPAEQPPYRGTGPASIWGHTSLADGRSC